jgi:hypothetical protein|tara:strand:- start:721 stop:993 length:273 start_codon:yes stop_codon:yes gene_type:complete
MPVKKYAIVQVAILENHDKVKGLEIQIVGQGILTLGHLGQIVEVEIIIPVEIIILVEIITLTGIAAVEIIIPVGIIAVEIMIVEGDNLAF